jgi:LPXTG-motif cell wall-anchored protein
VYSSARLPLHTVTGSITVTKAADSDPSDAPALFRLTDSVGTPVSLGSTTIGAGAIANGAGDDGIFQLPRGASATIGNLLFGGYIVTELRSDGFDVPMSVVTQAGASSQPAQSRAASVTLGDAPMNSLSLTFTNRLAPPPQEFDAPPPEGEETPPPEGTETPPDATPSDTPPDTSPGAPTDEPSSATPGDNAPEPSATSPAPFTPGAPSSGEPPISAPSPTDGGAIPPTGDASNTALLAIIFTLSAAAAALLLVRKISAARKK